MFQTWRQIFNNTLVVRIETKLDDFKSLIKNFDVSCRMPQRSPTIYIYKSLFKILLYIMKHYVEYDNYIKKITTIMWPWILATRIALRAAIGNGSKGWISYHFVSSMPHHHTWKDSDDVWRARYLMPRKYRHLSWQCHVYIPIHGKRISTYCEIQSRTIKI